MLKDHLMHYTFPTATMAKLAEYGWQPSRNIAPQHAILAWEQDGYSAFQAGVHFIQSFNGITLKHRSWDGKAEDESYFDSVLATQGFDRLWALEVYQPLIGKKLLPVGQGYSRHLSYLIAEDGAMYAGYDDFFCEIGTDIISALENIIFKRDFLILQS